MAKNKGKALGLALLALLCLHGARGERLLKQGGENTEPKAIVIESILPLPDKDHFETIMLRNVGKQEVDISSWTLSPLSSNSQSSFTFRDDTVLQPGETLELKRSSSSFCKTCFDFELMENDALLMKDASGEIKDVTSWSGAKVQSAIKRIDDGNYIMLPGKSDSFTAFMKGTVQFSMFLELLQHYDLDIALDGGSEPRCVRPRTCFLWYCPPAPPCVGAELPLKKEDGPFTVLVPTNLAIEKMLKEWGRSQGKEITNLRQVFDDPELSKKMEDIVRFHIIKQAAVMSADMALDAETFNVGNTLAPEKQYIDKPTIRNSTDKTGIEVVFFTDKAGDVFVHADCVDKPPPSEHGCDKQAEWGKCGEDWMNDNGTISGRPLGYCEMTCQKCTCDPSTCKQIFIPDVELKEPDGLSLAVHILDQVLSPPDQYDMPIPKSVVAPEPIRPPVYVWNPYTHQQETIAEWNAETRSYQTVTDENRTQTNGGPQLEYSWQYIWDTETGQYQYVMVKRP